jgi:probable phosphomutase (TIGR03848 family)
LTTILLIRHGTNDWVDRRIAGWTPGVHLNKAGQTQAKRLAEELSDQPIVALYSSPLERAHETAAPLAARLGLPVTLRDEFGELRFGEWQGRSLAELAEDPLWQRFNTARSTTRPPGGELMLETTARVIAGLEQVRAAHPHDLVAVFSHGDVIRAALLYYLGMPLDFFQRIEIHPASVSTVELSETGPRVPKLNWTGHEIAPRA